ncbi:hypothetical protein C7974DRAFT_386605 [Boeremia exigua]|uniref:uncharacterized protein n=1 Tax=Boeremia exigua TaxID=749465 RepID=UPI001E8CB3D2|nr:uncharacterized protein C7974DRAFT_386605 [Boeremia exigua]KAH6643021.1 hypothetical protein C7974DRAFT_386605 [Boeremia exigua]
MASDNALSVQRGNYAWTLPGPLLMIAGRLVCIPLQYAIITALPSTPTDLSFWPAALPAPPGPLAVFLGMTAVLVLKQSIWVLYICNEAVTLPFALFAGIADFMYESICAAVFTRAPSIPLWRPWMLYAGAAVHASAALAELAAELQRKRFKASPRNAGKLCASGLWGVVRHPNFALNVVYGAAYGFATAGPLFAGAPVAMYLSNFCYNAIPPKEAYLKGKYGDEWEGYRRVVRWKLFPGVY